MPDSMTMANPLMTDKALALSLAAPRAPPVGTAQREFLNGRDPSWHRMVSLQDCLDNENDDENAASFFRPQRYPRVVAHVLQHLQRVHRQQQQQQQHHHHKGAPPHPYLPAHPSHDDRTTRWLGSRVIPQSWLNAGRDQGTFRTVVDALVTIGAPTLAATASRGTLHEFRQLTRKRRRHAYGDHPMQFLELYLPDGRPVRQVLLFIHGGAWGSGVPWMYRLVAAPWVRDHSTAVAVLGYRTYPDSRTVKDQVEDCHAAILWLEREFPALMHEPRILMGHSSGAHVGLLLIVEMAKQRFHLDRGLKTKETTSSHDPPPVRIDAFVGLSGPYDISYHFDYEAGRAVEELSPMKPVNGHSRRQFHASSPHRQWQSYLNTNRHRADAHQLSPYMPAHMAFLHGMEDDTVPFTNTSETVRVLRACGLVEQCDEIYVAGTGHQDTILEMMASRGPTFPAVVEWFQTVNLHKGTRDVRLVAPSKL